MFMQLQMCLHQAEAETRHRKCLLGGMRWLVTTLTPKRGRSVKDRNAAATSMVNDNTLLFSDPDDS